MYALLNLMATDKSISFTCTASVLGYCLLPMALLSLIAAVSNFQVVIFSVLFNFYYEYFKKLCLMDTKTLDIGNSQNMIFYGFMILIFCRYFS